MNRLIPVVVWACVGDVVTGGALDLVVVVAVWVVGSGFDDVGGLTEALDCVVDKVSSDDTSGTLEVIVAV